MRPKDQYKTAIGLISHLVLTKPGMAEKFLANHGVMFNAAPNRKQLIGALIDLIAEDDPAVNQDLISLFTSHLKFKGQDLMELISDFPSPNEDQFLNDALGIAKSVFDGIGGLFGKKKRRRKAEEAKRKIAAAQAKARAKKEAEDKMFQLQMLQQQQAEERRRQDEIRRKEEREDKQRREERADRKRQNNLILSAIGGAMALLIVGGIVFRPKPN